MNAFSDIKPFLRNTEELRAAMDAADPAPKPHFFHMKARLPVKGRTDTLMATTPRTWVILKTYAEDGENELHAHVNEDHVFLVLQGQADFRGPKNEQRIIGRHEGLIVPAGTFYRFNALPGEQLVMARIGFLVNPGTDPHERIGHAGEEMDGFAKANRTVEVELHPTAVFG
ncbi:cupin domain-containing protein [Leptolyngbya sp. 15MV]|nr:cupin domain-containing protein [Leptolyngbya sp. 15MV]